MSKVIPWLEGACYESSADFFQQCFSTNKEIFGCWRFEVLVCVLQSGFTSLGSMIFWWIEVDGE